MTDRITVATIDSSPIFQIGLATRLRTAGRNKIKVIAQGNAGSDAREIGLTHKPDVMLLDIPMNGLAARLASDIRASSPDTKLAILTDAGDDENVIAALSAGFRGYLLKDILAEGLVQAIQDVHRGTLCITPSLAVKMVARQSQIASRTNDPEDQAAGSMKSELNYQEAQIMRLICRGLTNIEVARELKLAPQTVKNYMSRILVKYEVRHRTGAIAKFLANQAGSDVPKRVTPYRGHLPYVVKDGGARELLWSGSGIS